MSAFGKRLSATEKSDLLTKILELHARELTNEEIGEKVGLSRHTVRNWILEYNKSRVKPIADEIIDKRLRLISQALSVGIKRYLDTHSPRDWEAVRSQLDMEAKYLGLYAAEKLDVSSTVSTPLDNSIAALLSQMDAAESNAQAQ